MEATNDRVGALSLSFILLLCSAFLCYILHIPAIIAVVAIAVAIAGPFYIYFSNHRRKTRARPIILHSNAASAALHSVSKRRSAAAAPVAAVAGSGGHAAAAAAAGHAVSAAAGHAVSAAASTPRK